MTHAADHHAADHDAAHADDEAHAGHGSESFDERAASWDDEEKTARAQSVAATIAATVPCTPQTRLLEYGAGTGLVSQFLAPHVGSVILADPSEGMRAVAADKVAAGVLPAGAEIWDLNLDSDAPRGERFDLAVTVLALHHVSNLARTLEGLAAMLAPGGRLAIVDLEAEDGSFHDENPDVAHGFDEPTLAAALRSAGLDTAYHPGIYHIDKNGRPYPLFLAVGSRPHG